MKIKQQKAKQIVTKNLRRPECSVSKRTLPAVKSGFDLRGEVSPRPAQRRTSRKPSPQIIEKPEIERSESSPKDDPTARLDDGTGLAVDFENELNLEIVESKKDEAKREAREYEDQLVSLAQKGDTRAFELLVLKHQNRVITMIGRIVGEGDAPDVAQITFLKAWRALPGFQGNSQFYTWLYRIGINCAKNYLVARSRRPSYQDIDIADAELFGHTGQLSDADTPEHMLLSDEIKENVAKAISKLPPDLRQAISLRELEGLSYEEIAEVMGCPIGTVRSRIFRAREAIDVVLQPLIA